MDPKVEYWNVPCCADETDVERPADQRTRHEALHGGGGRASSARARDAAFFLYLAHTHAARAAVRVAEFAGKSPRGLYGDVVEELDWSVGGGARRRCESTKLEKSTLVVFSSDNGPWLLFDEQGGSAGPLRDGKGGTFEGGMRVPRIF